MLCKICNNQTIKWFSGKVLQKYNVQYFFCNNCKFLQTEQPYWLKEAYDPKMLSCDTGVMWRNIELSKIFSVLIYFLFYKQNSSFLDFGGGLGIFTRLMRDMGFDFYLHDRYLQNIVAQGFEFQNKKTEAIDLITSIECFEHLEHPIQEMEFMLSISPNILFTTQLLQIPAPKYNQWFYYGHSHGQHIAFYSKNTLEFIAKKHNLNFYTDNKFIHLFTTKKINSIYFNFLSKHAHKGLFQYVSKKMYKGDSLRWIAKDGNTINKIVNNP